MTDRRHHYSTHLVWTGAAKTKSFRNHVRSYEISAPGKPVIAGSSDPVFRGDAARWNPEDLLVASLSSCHKLWYMGLCAAEGIVVLAYEDEAEGIMVEEAVDGAGQFVQVTLHPRVLLAPGSDRQKAEQLHETAHANCFVTRSVNFPVLHEPVVEVAVPQGS
ncbi:OsmC family protein [Bradyrhizobium lablabi]|uniref:OsmC family protein n=1 Tax=Bradyrhizobium lablabi TaxID=722472 RepID=UPI001BA9CF3E|nr:OsmC family protein [Bradyrhizobium lablabi]MBR1121533.1 OsmC family protein [Bradyrhizobium lablabi]